MISLCVVYEQESRHTRKAVVLYVFKN
jgi:hypothetical protein